MRKSKQGLWMVILSGIVFGLMPGAVTYCYNQGANATILVVIRYAIVAIIMFPWTVKAGNSIALLKRYWKQLLCLVLVTIATPVLLYSAYSYLPTGMVTSLHFLFPTLVVVFCAIFFRDRPTWRKLLCMALCLAGTLLVLGFNGNGTSVSKRGVALALGSAVTWALYIVWLDKMDLKDVSLPQLLFFVDGGSFLLLTLIYGPLSGTLPIRMTPLGWVAAILVNLFIGVFGTAFFTFGVWRSDAQAAAIASTTEPITSLAVGILFLGEPFSIRSLFGSALILTAVILLATHTDKEVDAIRNIQSKESQHVRTNCF